MPSEDKFLRGEGLPTVGAVKFRASATNYVEFKNFFEVRDLDIKDAELFFRMLSAASGSLQLL